MDQQFGVLPTGVVRYDNDMRYPAMRKQPAIETDLERNGRVTVLSISPLDEDHSSLRAIVGHSKWMLFKARDLVSTLAVLKQHEISVLLCERDLLPGTWKDVMEHVNAMPNSPSLIVASRLADDRLWAEVLTFGCLGCDGETI
jgi:hypothetical protein